MKIRWPRLVFVLGLTALLTYLAVPAAGAYAYAHALTHPGCPGPPWNAASLGLQPESVTVQTRDGLKLAGWWLAPSTEPGPAIILLPGWGGNRDQMLREARFLHARGYGALTVDTRNCAGVPTTLGYYEVATVGGAIDFLRSRTEVDPQRIGVLGFSAGGATAIRAAEQFPELHAAVASGNFYDLARDITNDGQESGPFDWLAHRFILFFFWQQTGVRAEAVSPISVIGQISPRPVFLIFGAQELETARGRDQYVAAGEPKELWVVPGAGHGEYMDVAPEEYERRVVEFFDRRLH